MPETTSKVEFLETSRGSLQVGEGQRLGYPAPLHRKHIKDWNLLLE